MSSENIDRVFEKYRNEERLRRGQPIISPVTNEGSPENIIKDPRLIPNTFDIKMSLDQSQLRALKFWPVMYKDHCIFFLGGLMCPSEPVCSNQDLFDDDSRLVQFKLNTEQKEKACGHAKEIAELRSKAFDLAKKWHSYEKILVGDDTEKMLKELIPLWNETYKLKKAIKDLAEQEVYIGAFSLSFILGTL
jgi:hypothetical protein